MNRRPQASNDALLSAVTRLPALLQAGEATRGLQVDRSRGGIVLARSWMDNPSAEPEPDPRFRLTPLSGAQFGLSLWRLDRWERLPFEGTLHDLVEIMNTVLAHWATE